MRLVAMSLTQQESADMADPFGSPVKALGRQRSRPDLKMNLPAPPSARNLSAIAGDLTPDESPLGTPFAATHEIDFSGHGLQEHLQSLLERKTGQLQLLGSMGQEILKQQQELEERIREFQDSPEDSLGDDAKAKLKELDAAMQIWEGQNEEMLRELGGKVSIFNPHPRDQKLIP